jgi:hypothetical protein
MMLTVYSLALWFELVEESQAKADLSLFEQDRRRTGRQKRAW